MATLYSAHTIKNTLTLLSAYAKSINHKTEMIKAKNRFINDMNLIITMTDELLLTTRTTCNLPVSHREMTLMQNQLKDMMHRIRNLQEEQQEELKQIVGPLEMYKEWEFHRISNYESERWVDYLADNIYDEDREELSATDTHQIMTHINLNRPYNIFSPRCGRGKGLELIAVHGDCTSYGLEGRDSCHARAKENISRAIKGEINGSKISNDCFDIMHVCPPISWNAELGATGNLVEKKEKSWLRNTIKYLRKDGILIFTIPVTRCTKDMAYIFSRFLNDVQVISASLTRNSLNYVHIIGKKEITKEAKQDIYAYLSNLPKMTQLPTELDFSYDLASGGITVPELFRGSVLDESELEYLIENSGLMSSFWKQHEIEEKDTSMRPLLPFNMGQIGLVLTSGCLDGVVEEYEGQYHAIKGMVTKVRDFNDSRENNDETSIETISNKVQINLLTPDGKFIELA